MKYVECPNCGQPIASHLKICPYCFVVVAKYKKE